MGCFGGAYEVKMTVLLVLLKESVKSHNFSRGRTSEVDIATFAAYRYPAFRCHLVCQAAAAFAFSHRGKFFVQGVTPLTL